MTLRLREALGAEDVMFCQPWLSGKQTLRGNLEGESFICE